MLTRHLTRVPARLALAAAIAGGPLLPAVAATALPATAQATPAKPASALAAPRRGDTSQDGPHAPGHRTIPAATVAHRDGVAISHYDLGDVEIGARPGQFRAPVRGSLITPDGTSSPSKFVIVSHLRAPGCADGDFAYPCHGKEMRLDRGMEYLGAALAKKGYTVLIPDLAPVWIGGTLTSPYDQYSAWLKVVGPARDALAASVAGTRQPFGLDLTGRIDLSGVGLIVHSRSGYVAGPVATAWAHGATPVRSILAYGPAYDVPDGDGRISPPVPSNVPFLALVGDADQDVPFNAPMWLAQNIGQKRTAPALAATVPGLGHNYVNEALSSAQIDDRLGCTPSTCASAEAHPRFLTDVSAQYLDATLRSHGGNLPLTAGSALPRQLDGLPTRWLAVTNAADRVTIFDADTARAPRVSRGSTATMCRFFPADDPARHTSRCAEPDLGTDMLVSRVARVRLAPGGTVSFPTHVTQAAAVDLQLTPYGDRADKRADSPVQVSVVTATGRRVSLTLPADAGDVTRNRSTADANGTYVLGTLRVGVPARLRTEVITSVEVRAPRGGEYAVRNVDVRGSVASGGQVSSPAPAAVATTPGTGSKPGTTTLRPAPSHGTQRPDAPSSVIGPLVQTDHAESTASPEVTALSGAEAVILLAALATVIRRFRG